MARSGIGSRGYSTERSRAEVEDYWRLSSRPLHVLVLIAPLVIAYEIGAVLYLTGSNAQQTTTIAARKVLQMFFANFGVAGVVASGAVLAAVLLVLLLMHIMSKQSWKIRWMVLAGMVLEAALWALPLVVFGAVFKRAAAIVTRGVAEGHVTVNTLAAAALQGRGGTEDLKDLPLMAKATIAVGAGIYEELLFRLIGIAALHFVVRDVLQGKETVAKVIAVLGTAVAFAAYHPIPPLNGGVNWPLLAFFTVAGVYFGVIYVNRGLGIVVATHAIYDLIALDVLSGMR